MKPYIIQNLVDNEEEEKNSSYLEIGRGLKILDNPFHDSKRSSALV